MSSSYRERAEVPNADLQPSNDPTHSGPAEVPDTIPDPSNPSVGDRKIGRGSDYRSFRVFLIVTVGVIMIGIMHGIDILDTSEKIDTKCTYGIFLITLLSFMSLFALVTHCIHRCKGSSNSSQNMIDFVPHELPVFFIFAILKVVVILLNLIWFWPLSHNYDGNCKNASITITAYFFSLGFTVCQCILLFMKPLLSGLKTSYSLYILLVLVNFGFVWFDLSVEVLHLKHYIHHYAHLNPKALFYAIQGMYWTGLEFHVVFVEILIKGWLESRDRKNSEGKPLTKN